MKEDSERLKQMFLAHGGSVTPLPNPPGIQFEDPQQAAAALTGCGLTRQALAAWPSLDRNG